MKNNNDTEVTLSVEQLSGGYIVRDVRLGGIRPSVHNSFKDLVNDLDFRLGITEIGEKIIISSNLPVKTDTR